jgi:prepilin-type N-terminal cleavage/methylation domain-containing protein
MAGPKLQGKEGFSLIEVLVALVILAVGLLALAMFQVTAIRGNAVASKWTIATQLSQDRLERFRHVAWDNIVSSPAGGYNTGTMQPVYASLPGAQGDSQASRGTQFYRVWNVNNDSTTLKTITVWTCWQDELARWHNVMLVTQRVNIGGV